MTTLANPLRDDRGADQLSRSLKSRHVSMITFGGIIGAGLFVGSSTAISTIGPAAVLSYALAGFLGRVSSFSASALSRHRKRVLQR